MVLVAVVAYLLGRLVGTYEFYVGATAFAMLVVVSWTVTLLSGSRLHVNVKVEPDNPVAGDPLEFTVHLENHSFLPTSALTLAADLAPAAGEDLALDLSPLAPRGTLTVTSSLAASRRGAFTLPAPRVTLTDPFGIARRRRPVGGELIFTVLPRIAVLRNCVFFGGHGLGRLGRLRGALVHGSYDFRGVRPHQPGEPLSRIDWKSTAKTGVLMLREVDEPARNEVAIVVDGTVSMVVGKAPDDTYEASVAAAGSIGEFVLREGLGTVLFLHRAVDQHLPCESGQSGRMHLLQNLAATRADATVQLAESMRRNEALLARGMAVVVVTPAYDRGLLLALTRLRERGLPVFLVHVDARSFLAAETGSGAAEPEGPAAAEVRRFLLRLAHSGVPSVALRRGEPLDEVLSFRSVGAESGALA